MGNSVCCCASDDSTRKDKELDMYINKHHKEAYKMTKFDKKDYILSKQDLPVRTYKA